MSFVIDNCQLEVDTDRGVIYIHSPEGFTALRISGVRAGAPIPSPRKMLDIGLKLQPLKNSTFNWKKESK